MPTPTLTLAMNDPDSELVEAIAPRAIRRVLKQKYDV